MACPDSREFDLSVANIAEEAVQKIDSKLNCAVCLESFREPKLLPCFHVFCKSPCLERLVIHSPEGQSLTCPTCRHHVTLPDTGVAGLQTDFHVEHLFEIKQALEKAKKGGQCPVCNKESTKAVKFCQQCQKAMCEKCSDIHGQWGEFDNHKIVGIDQIVVSDENLLSTKLIATCQKHSRVEAKIYCQTCSELICTDCALSVHKDHCYRLIEDLYPEYKEEIIFKLKPLKEKQNKVHQALEMCDTKAQKIRSQKTVIESNISLKIDQLHEILEKRKASLMAILESETAEKLKELATHRENVETMYVRMTSCVDYTESSLEMGAESKVVTMKTPVLKQIEQITKDFDPDAIEPQIEAGIDFEVSNDADEACQMLGEIVCDSVSVENSYASGSGTSFALAHALNSVEVHVLTKQNKVVESKATISSQLVHSKSGAIVECKVAPEKNYYVVSFCPTVKGKYYLHIRVNNEHIEGSPYTTAVIRSLENFHLPKAVQSLSMPYGIVTNSQEQIIAVERFDYHKHCFTVLTPERKKIFSTGTRGIINGHFDFPRGVAVDADDNIYIADKDNYRIQKFTSEGKFVAAVGSRTKKFACPTGICFNKMNSQLYICDQLNNKIKVISTDLVLVNEFGAEGENQGLLKSPMYASFDSEANNLYVTDFGNNQVQVFTAEGEFVRAFSDKSNHMKLEQPFAIAADSSNIVYVSEWEKNSISVFTGEGKYIMSFGSSGSKEGEFNKIRGIHVDQNDFIYVSDHKNNRVQIF